MLDVEHQRTGRALHVDEVEVELQLETRGTEHADRVVAALRERLPVERLATGRDQG